MSVWCESCVLPGRDLCVGVETPPRRVLTSVVRLSVIVKPASIMRSPWPTRGCCAMEEKRDVAVFIYISGVPRNFVRGGVFNKFS